MDTPHRFVVTTCNIWERARWPERSAPLRSYLELTGPDVLAIQELRPETREVIDDALPSHDRVEDPFVGWLEEGTIYWRRSLFEEVEHGAEDVGHVYSPNRRLFWVRLRHRPSGSTVLVTTVHFTWQGNPGEREAGQSPRNAEARATLAALERLSPAQETGGEPVLFMGDLNDATNAIKTLREGGLTDSSTATGSPLLPTHPARPTATGVPQVLDWQFHRGEVRALTSHVGDYFLDDVAPSDHKPVVVTYGIGPE
jgi:endonuclease/exonuclease/phosphatase (EEP) superfamily protein YafD